MENKENTSIRQKIIFAFLILAGLISCIIINANAYIIDGDLDDSQFLAYNEYKSNYITNENRITEFTFASHAYNEPNKYFGFNPNNMIGKYTYVSTNNAIDHTNCFCLGHGNTAAGQYTLGAYCKIAAIWDIDLDNSKSPGTSKLYSATGRTRTVSVGNVNDTGDTDGDLITKWAEIAWRTEGSTLRTPQYPENNNNYNSYLQKYRSRLLKNDFTSSDIASDSIFYEDGNYSFNKYLARVQKYKFNKENATDNNGTTKQAEIIVKRIDGSDYSFIGPFKISSSKDGEDDYISNISVSGISGNIRWSENTNSVGRNDYNNIPSNRNFYVVVNGVVPSNTEITVNIAKEFKVYSGRTMFFKNTGNRNGAGQHLIVYRVNYGPKTYTLNWKVKRTEEPKGKLSIVKTDEYTGNTLKGAEFTVKQKSSGKYVVASDKENGKYELTSYSSTNKTTFKTGDNGIFEISKLDAGDYIVQETKAPDGYVQTSSQVTVHVFNEHELSSEYHENLEYALKTMLDEVINDNDTPSLSKIYNYVFGTTTSDDGLLATSTLKEKFNNFKSQENFDKCAGKEKAKIILKYIFENYKTTTPSYSGLTNKKLEEIKNNDSDIQNYLSAVYNKMKNKTISKGLSNVFLQRSKGFGAQIMYNKMTGRVRVYKVSQDNSIVKLKGAKFKIQTPYLSYLVATKDSNGIYNVTGTNGTGTIFETNDNGYFEVRGMDEGGDYSIEEIEAPEGYKFIDTSSKTLYVYSYNRFSNEDNIKRAFKQMFKSVNLNSSKYSSEGYAILKSLLLNDNATDSHLTNENDIDTIVDYVLTNKKNTIVTLLDHNYTINQIMNDVAANAKSGGNNAVLEEYFAQVYSKYSGQKRKRENAYNIMYATKALGYDSNVVVNPLEDQNGNIVIYKTDKKDETKKLSGATFKIEKMRVVTVIGGNNNPVYLKATKKSDGIYDASDTSNLTDEFVTNSNGYIQIKNIPITSSVREIYEVVEVQAPYGYNISTSSSKTITVQKEEANKGWELKDLTKALATMIWNTKSSDSSTINVVDIVDAVQGNSLNSAVIANELMSKLGKSKVTTYDEIYDVIEYVIAENQSYVVVTVDSSEKYLYKRHQNSAISMIDAIQAIKQNKKIGGTSVSDGKKYLKNYIAQVYNKFTGKNRDTESLYNLKYYSIACGSSAETFANSKDVKLKVKKTDYKTGKGINGIKFAIQNTETGKYLKKQNDGTFTFSDTQYLFTTAKVEGDDGIILLEDVPEATYKVIEINTGNTGYELPEYGDDRSLLVSRDSKTKKITSMYESIHIENGIKEFPMENVKPKTRKYPPVTVTKQLKVSGKVWKDIPTELKDRNVRDDIYGSNDQLFAGVPVSLVQDSKTVATTATKANGTYTLNFDLTDVIKKVNNDKEVKKAKEEADNFEARDYTDEIARYNEYIEYYKADLKAVSQYPNPELVRRRTIIDNEAISKYTNRINELITRIHDEDTYHENLCKVYEALFNEKYNQYLLEELGKSKIIFGYNGLDYTNVLLNKGSIDEGTSSLAAEIPDERTELNTDFGTITGDSEQKIRDKKIEYEFSEEYVNVKENDTMKINAYTAAATLKNRYNSLSNKSNNVTEITNINLGVYVRSRPDLSLRKDVYSAEITMDGKAYTYVYGKKDGEELTTIGAAFERNMMLREDDKYLAPVYRADVQDAGHNNFTMKVTYRIAVINNSPVLYNKVTKLEDYYSSRYKIDAVYAGTKTQKGAKIKNLTDSTNTVEKHVTIDGLNLRIPNSKSPEGNAKYIYVDFYVNPISLDMFDTDLELHNTAEISNYSTYSNDGYTEFYGGFDIDSVPNNCKKTYKNHDARREDDVDGAPGLKITEATTRKLQGTVFLDEDIDGITGTGKERLGDGIFNSSKEQGIAGAEVILEDTKNGNKFTVRTDDAGKYTFSDFPVGTYTLTYKWGNKTYNPLYYKSTIINKGFNPTDKINWYQNIDPNKAYSVAIDDEETRMNIDKNSTTRYKDMLQNSAEAVETMTSKAIQDVEVEMLLRDKNKVKYEVKNINFGIIERPRQSMKITKNISHIKVMDDYGTVIDESDIENGKLTAEKMNFTVYIPKGQALNPYGQVKTELDKEYLPAKVEATYEIKVENRSEQDYFKKNESGLSEYYKYGTKDVPDESPVKLQATGVMDYASSAFVISDIKEDNGNIITADDYLIEDKDYYKKVAETTGVEYQDNKTYTTVIEKAYQKLIETIGKDSSKILTYEWATDEQTIRGIFSQWCDEKTYTEENARTSKLSQNKILELKCLEGTELGAGDAKAVTIKGSIPVTSLNSDVLLQNQAEILNIDKTSTFGHKSYETYTTLYDQGEEVKVIPPTGENKDNSDMIIIAISSIVGLLVIGIGIIFIRRKILR